MKYKNILVTGGAGFVGSTIAINLKKHFSDISVISLDNLSRRGSELTLPRLRKHGVTFIYGDVRRSEDLDIKPVDLIIECSAEPSVLGGINSSPRYLVSTNLLGAFNCFEQARQKRADVIFLSTSRVYPVDKLNSLPYRETETRFEFTTNRGINEEFPLTGVRTLYGATKLSAEMLLAEYCQNYGIHAVINRFGVIAGPWQMGRVDQGFIALWVGHHVFGKPLEYIGFGGKGKQVRDVVHVDDVFDLLVKQTNNLDTYKGDVFNIGGGKDNSVSLFELTQTCQKIGLGRISVKGVKRERPGDVRIYITDNSKVAKETGWRPKRTLEKIIDDTYRWISSHKRELVHVLE